jgi:sugar phosphate permease
MSTTLNTTATQIAHPWVATGRTILQTTAGGILAFASFTAGLAVFAPQLLAAIVDVLPANWAAYATGAVTVISTFAGATAHVMAIPGVNEYLTKIHLGVVAENGLDSMNAVIW